MSRSLNKVMLIGNVGSDPEVRATASGARVAKLSLATNRSFQGKDGQQQDRTDWHRLTFFGKLAASGRVPNGSLVFLPAA